MASCTHAKVVHMCMLAVMLDYITYKESKAAFLKYLKSARRIV